MKNLTLILLITFNALLFTFHSFSQPCLPEGITFTTQAQIDSFQINYPNCPEIEGDVIINGQDITNLNGLTVLTSVGGSLNIGIFGGNPSLPNLIGLDNLISIGGDLHIEHNDILNTLTGIENLSYIGGNLSIEIMNISSLAGLENLSHIGQNLVLWFVSGLTNLTGLENLSYIGGGIWIHGAGDLTSLTGLVNVTSIHGPLIIVANYNLVNLTGFENLTSIGGDIYIEHNINLTSLTGLENVTSIGGYLEINENNNLISLTGLENVSHIGGDLRILSNDDLTSLAGLDNIEGNSIEDLSIHNNQNLSACEVQSVCDYLLNSGGGDVYIYENATGCNSIQEVEEACASCLPEGIDFTTQSQIDSFQINYPNCTEIEGAVEINGDDITNLNGLSNLTSIGNKLEIEGCPSLANLSGFENLTSVGYMEINSNTSLVNLSGLSNLTSLWGYIYLYDNSSLINLSGLEGLDSIASLRIGNNDALTSLSGLDNLTSFNDFGIYGSNLYIHDNDALLSLTGLESLTSLHKGIEGWESHISIDDNNALVSLEGIENIDVETVQNLSITNNPSLSVCDAQWVCNILSDSITGIFIENNAPGCNSPEEVEEACASCLPEGITFTTQAQIDNFQIDYPGCTEIEGDVKIYGDDINNLNGLNVLTLVGGNLFFSNTELTGLTGLENLSSVAGNVTIGGWGPFGNNSLQSLTGLDGLNNIGGTLEISSNPVLDSLTGLDNLTTVGGNLRIGNGDAKSYEEDELMKLNSSLKNLSGLNNLTSIGGSLIIEVNESLNNIAALANLNSIGGNLEISANALLTELTGLDNINAGSIQSLIIYLNNALSLCNVPSICDYLDGPNGATAEIHYNAPGCNSPEEVEEACDTLSVKEISFDNTFLITPNPVNSYTVIEYILHQRSPVILQILDLSSQEMVTLVNEVQLQGEQNVLFDTSGLPAGVYFCVLKTNEGIQTTKMIKL